LFGFYLCLILNNYPSLDCSTECNWSDFCTNTKWYWQGDENNSKEIKLNDYCRFKKTLNDVYYKVIVDSNHEKTLSKIKFSI